MSNSVREDACACQSPPTPIAEAQRIVTLVHGTYAPHADWIQDDRSLTRELTAVAGTVLDRFCWSGKNMHHDRLQAGRDLREHLVDLIASFRDAGSNAEHYVIAHSHGGNVALYALRDQGDGDDALLANVKVVTLATPFLTMRERPLPKYLFGVLALLLASGVLSGWLAIQVAIWAASPEGLEAHVSNGVTLMVLSFLWAGFGIGGCLGFVWSLLAYRRRTPGTSLIDLLTGAAASDASARVTAPRMDSDRLLVIRGVGDEAGGVLGGAQLAAWMMARITKALRPTNVGKVLKGLYKTMIVFVFVSLLQIFEWVRELVRWVEERLPSGDLGWTSIQFLGACAAVAVFGSTLLALLTTGFVAIANLPFGRDTLFWNLHAQTTAEPSPIGSARVLVVEALESVDSDESGGLAHSVYDEHRAISAMVAYVTGLDPYGAAYPS